MEGIMVCPVPAGCPGAACPGSRSALGGPSPWSQDSDPRAGGSSWNVVLVHFGATV